MTPIDQPALADWLAQPDRSDDFAIPVRSSRQRDDGTLRRDELSRGSDTALASSLDSSGGVRHQAGSPAPSLLAGVSRARVMIDRRHTAPPARTGGGAVESVPVRSRRHHLESAGRGARS
jgi:hypothetical protein